MKQIMTSWILKSSKNGRLILILLYSFTLGIVNAVAVKFATSLFFLYPLPHLLAIVWMYFLCKFICTNRSVDIIILNVLCIIISVVFSVVLLRVIYGEGDSQVLSNICYIQGLVSLLLVIKSRILSNGSGLLCAKFGHRMAFGVVPFVSVVFLVLYLMFIWLSVSIGAQSFVMDAGVVVLSFVWIGIVEFGFYDVRSVRNSLAITYCLVNSGLLISALFSNWILGIIFTDLPQENANLAVLLEHLIVFVICNLSASAFYVGLKSQK